MDVSRPLTCVWAVGPGVSAGGLEAFWWRRDGLKSRSDAPTSMPTIRVATRPFAKCSRRPLREDVFAMGMELVWPGCWMGSSSRRGVRSSACLKRSRTRAMIWDCSGDEMAAGSRRLCWRRVISCLCRYEYSRMNRKNAACFSELPGTGFANSESEELLPHNVVMDG